jgi:protein-disulfide isomerase
MAKPKRSMPRAWADPRAAQTAKPAELIRSRTLWFRTALTGFLFVSVALGTILLIKPDSSSAGQDGQIDHKVSALLAGIPQEGRTLGTSSAPVTLQVFADLEDSDSKRWFLTLLPAIIRTFVRTGILKIEYRSFKTNTIGSEIFVKQQAAALAAGAQDKLWNYVDTFYHEQGQEYTPYVTESYIDSIASQVPDLNIGQWHKDRDDGWRVEEVVEEDQEGRTDGIHVTPAYRLGLTGNSLKNIAGSEAITFPGQLHPTTFASVNDIAKAIRQIL